MRADEYCRVYFREMTEHMGSVQTMLWRLVSSILRL